MIFLVGFIVVVGVVMALGPMVLGGGSSVLSSPLGGVGLFGVGFFIGVFGVVLSSPSVSFGGSSSASAVASVSVAPSSVSAASGAMADALGPLVFGRS